MQRNNDSGKQLSKTTMIMVVVVTICSYYSIFGRGLLGMSVSSYSNIFLCAFVTNKQSVKKTSCIVREHARDRTYLF